MAERDRTDGADGGLPARTALAGALGGITIEETSGLALVTVALPSPADRLRAPSADDGDGTPGDGGPDRSGEAGHRGAGERDGSRDGATRARLERAFGTALPPMGRSTRGERGERLLGLHADRLFVLFAPADEAEAADPERALAERLRAARGRGEAGGDADGRDHDMPGPYLADQSDGWVMLRLAGPRRRDALERLCPLDLHPTVFPVGAVARTVMEHLAVIVLNESDDAFLLLSPRSSAGSFLHEIETAVASARSAAGTGAR